MTGYRRLLALGALLVTEYLIVSFLYDVRALGRQPGALGVLAYLGDAATVVLLAAAGVLIVQGAALKQRVAAALQSQDAGRTVWPFLVAHFAAYASFVALSGRVLSEQADASVVATWVLPWLLSGVALVLLLVPVALPLSAARALLTTGLRALLAAVGVGLLIWGIAKAGERLWPLLSGPTLDASGWLLSRVVSGEIVKTDDMLFGTPEFVVRIAPVCSGLEGMGLMLAFLGGFMIVHREQLRFPQALWILPVAVGASWCANVVRIVALVLVGAWVSPEVAIGGFHSKAGWFFFCLLAFGFVVLLRRSPLFSRETAEPGRAGEAAPAELPAYLMPLLALLATVLVTGLFTAAFDWLYGVRVAVVGAVLWAYREHYRSLWVRPGWEAIAIGVATFAIWIALVPRQGTEGAEALQRAVGALQPPLQAAWVALRVVGSVVIVPIAEELAFRGYLLRRLISPDFTAVSYRTFSLVAFLVSSLAFGLLHSAPLAGTLAGMAYALAQQRKGRLSDAIAAHAITNGLIAIDVLVFGAWGLW